MLGIVFLAEVAEFAEMAAFGGSTYILEYFLMLFALEGFAVPEALSLWHITVYFPK